MKRWRTLYKWETKLIKLSKRQLLVICSGLFLLSTMAGGMVSYSLVKIQMQNIDLINQKIALSQKESMDARIKSLQKFYLSNGNVYR